MDALNLVWNYSGIAGDIGDLHLRIFASDHQEVDIADMVAQVDEAQLLSVLQDVEGERHFTAAPAHLEAVRNQMLNAFDEANLQAEDHDFVHNSVAMRNILGRKPGAKDESITYIIDGHFDGVPNSPGADDNGSAVAGVLEALRILSQYEFEHSIRFIGFDAEELGLVGSLRYVQNGIKPFESIEGVFNFEMIGYYSDEPNSQQLPAGFGFLFPEAEQAVADEDFRGNFLTVVGNVASNPLIAAYLDAADAYVPVSSRAWHRNHCARLAPKRPRPFLGCGNASPYAYGWRRFQKCQLPHSRRQYRHPRLCLYGKCGEGHSGCSS